MRDKKSNVVYKISCKSCDASYVGQLRSRITEHENYIRWNTFTRNIIKEHWLQEGYDFDWDNVTRLEETLYKKRWISEMIFIRKQMHRTQLADGYGGVSLPPDHRQTIKA